MHAIVVFALLHPDPLTSKLNEFEATERMAILKAYWVGVGVLQPDERGYFTYYWRVDDDQEDMIWRQANTPDDAPPVDALCGLPTADTTESCLNHSLAYIRYLDWLWPYLYGAEWDEWQLVYDDAKARREIWKAIMDCRTSTSWGSKEGLRIKLNTLRELVGADAFDRGEWPSPVPDAARNSIWKDAPPEWEWDQ